MPRKLLISMQQASMSRGRIRASSIGTSTGSESPDLRTFGRAEARWVTRYPSIELAHRIADKVSEIVKEISAAHSPTGTGPRDIKEPFCEISLQHVTQSRSPSAGRSIRSWRGIGSSNCCILRRLSMFQLSREQAKPMARRSTSRKLLRVSASPSCPAEQVNRQTARGLSGSRTLRASRER